ncbi:MAG: glycosyltransferase family 4 protein [Candidatus Woesearchaeota archaeon]
MKIAFTQAFYLPVIDGPGQVIHEIARRYVKQGHEVHVFCADHDKYGRIKKKEEIIDGVYVHRCFNWFTIVNFATFFPSVFFRLLKGNFDVVHSHVSGHSYVLFSALASRIKKIPHVHTTHCCWTSGFRSVFGRAAVFLIYHALLPLMFRWTDRIVGITPWEIEDIKKWGGKEERIRIIPNGMDKIFFRKIKPNTFKKKLGIKGKMVLFFGRLNPTKGPEKLAIVAKQMLKERDDVDFVFVGPDEGKKAEVEGIIKGEKKIHMLGPILDRKKVVEMYQAADVYCLPSYREGLPLTLFEAMAAGCPIVASPVNGIPYEMKDPDNGFLVKYGDIVGLEKAISKILDSKKLAARMRKNNIRTAKRYDWDIIAKRYMDVYREVV